MSPCSLTHLVHWCKKHVNWLASEMGNGQWRMKWVVGRRRGLVESTIPLLLSIPNSFTERRGVPWKHEVRGKVQNYYDLFNECFWREVSPHQNELIFQRFQRGDIRTFVAKSRTFVVKSAIWFSENEGGWVKGHMELFRKFIRFGDGRLPQTLKVSHLKPAF